MSKNVINVLKEKAEDIAKGTALIVDSIKDWQMIKSYMSNRIADIKLTPIQQEKLNRYQYIYNQLVSRKYSQTEIINQIITLYGADQTQAYEDLRCTKELFNTVININKRFELQIELEGARALLRKCEKIDDFKNAAAIGKNIVAIIKELQEPEEVNTNLFEGHIIEAVFNPKLIGAPDISDDDYNKLLKEIEAKRGKKKTNIEDVNFEDVK